MANTTANAIRESFQSPNVCDQNFEPANIVDTTNYVALAVSRLAAAITPNIGGCKDAAGGHVESLTESVLGVTSGLFAIAKAIESLADSVRESRQ